MAPETALEHYRAGRHVFNHEWAKALIKAVAERDEARAERDEARARLTIAVGGQP